MPHPADAAHIWSPLATQIGQLDEAADLLEPSRPDLAEACRETAQTLREETELADWLATPEGVPTPC